MFIMDHRKNVSQQDFMGYGLWHVLCSNLFILFSGGRAPAGMLCLVWDHVLQGRDRLLETVQITEVLMLPNLEQKNPHNPKAWQVYRTLFRHIKDKQQFITLLCIYVE